MNKNLLIVLAILLFNIGYGQDLKTWTGAQSTAWDDDANWAPEGMPTFDNDILISNGPNVLYQPIISIPGITCGTLTLQNSTPGSIVVLTVKGLGGLTTASIIMNSSVATSKCSLNIGSTVTVKGDVKMNGTALQNDVTFSGDGNLLIGGMMTGGSLNTGTVSDQKGTVTYNGTTTRSVGAYSYHNLTLSGSGVRTIGSGVIVNGTLTMTGSATASAAPVYGDNAALRYNSVSNQTVGPEWVTPFVSKGGVQISTIAPKVVTIGDNLEKKFDKGVSLIIDSEASLVVGNNSNMYFSGNFMNSEGSLITDGYVYLTGTSNQNIGGFVSTKGVVMSKTAGTATFTANVKAEELTIDGIGGALNLGKNLTHTFTKWIRTQGTLNGGSSILKISGDVVGNGSNFVPGTGTVEFNGEAQNLGSGSITYNNLVLSGTGVKTFGAKTTINDTFSIATGVVADLTAGFVHTAKSIKLGGNAGSGGSWGSSLSNAVNKNNVYFTSNSGIVNVGPTIVVSTNSLPALTTIYGTPSVSKNFDITGIAMLEGIVVTPSSEFEVSTDGITFANTLTLGATGNIAQSKIYVRLKATTAAGSYSSGNIALTSNGTTTVNIPIATSTVDKAELTIKAENKEKAYGSDNPVLTVSYDGFVNGETVAILIKLPTITTTAVKGSVAGTTYPITATGAEALNYKFKYEPINGSLTITPVALTITTNDNSKVYGSQNPVLTVSYDGFVPGETEANLTAKPTIATTAVTGSPVGKYEITATGAASSNYKIIYVNKGSLTITPAALTITTNDNSKVYGSQNPVLTVSYDGFVPGETEANLTAKPTIATTAVTGSPVGKYEITATGAASLNYK
ncbi:MBG domain-containing protein, partial [Flavobacterium sp. AJR]|uniref:MBG domain-containing protein n=1 Tax=Flavobacterium sp. AJR TaxID=1979369 RepID=UPI000B674990